MVVDDGRVYYDAAGGKPSVVAALDPVALPTGHGLMASDGRIVVPAGETIRAGNVELSCPSGGVACVVVASDAGAGYEATGAAPVATAALDPVTLPPRHGLMASDGRIVIPAGATIRAGNIELSCPSGGAACVVVAGVAGADYEATGGTPVAAAALDPVTLPTGHGLMASDGRIVVPAGATIRVGNIELSCPSGGAACVVVAGVAGAEYEATGGKPVATAALDPVTLPTGHGLMARDGRIVVPAGETIRVGNIELSCPSGGAACVVVAGVAGADYEATGGTPVATAALDPLDLPLGHGLVSVTVEGGDTHHGDRGVRLDCPSGPACVVAVGEDGAATWEATGGEPTVLTDEMILAANQPGRVSHIRRTIASLELYDEPAALADSVVQSSVIHPPDPEPTVTVRVVRDTDTDPVFDITLSTPGFGLFGQSQSDPIVIQQEIDSAIPDLSGGWLGAALAHRVEGGTTVHATVWSDIWETVPELTLIGGEPAHVTSGGELATNLDLSGVVFLTDDTAPIQFVAQVETPLGEVVDILIETSRTNWEDPVSVGTWVPVAIMAGPYQEDRYGFQVGNTSYDARLTCVTGSVGQGEDVACEAATVPGEVHLLRSLQGRWRLEVNEVENRAPVEDEEYLTLGTWLSLPDRDDGRFDVGVFADGASAFERDDLDSLTGTAEYVGPATGIYGTADPTARIGSFVATATLQADFGANAGPTGDSPTVSGYVRDFMENGVSLGDWSVELDPVVARTGDPLFTHHPDDVVGADTVTSTVSGEADGRILTGQWGARFFRNGGEWHNDFGVGGNHPGYVAGTFTAATPSPVDTLEIIGSFGAERQ